MGNNADNFLAGNIVGAILAMLVMSIFMYFVLESLKKNYETQAVQSGCATRVLDTLSGDVKTVWKGEKE